MLWLKSLNKIFVTGLLIAATVPHESEKRYSMPVLSQNYFFEASIPASRESILRDN
jgi:hypothetical protein